MMSFREECAYRAALYDAHARILRDVVEYDARKEASRVVGTMLDEHAVVWRNAMDRDFPTLPEPEKAASDAV
jgi:hypothetical protein